ncbi:hypothetical protein CSV61_16280 [Sporosarcina sp. P3]|nr:hypothetical protein CSV61_16280 [Sporosarcina sp. P3]
MRGNNRQNVFSCEDDMYHLMRCISHAADRYRHVDRIYQSRYFAKEVDTPQALLAVSRYIHRNPIETKIPMVDCLTDYPFSSFPSYSEDTGSSLTCMDTHSILRYLPPTFEKTRSGYVSYCLHTIDELLGMEEYMD